MDSVDLVKGQFEAELEGVVLREKVYDPNTDTWPDGDAQWCLDGYAISIVPECENNGDCRDPARPVCNHTSNACGECDQASDCHDPTLPICGSLPIALVGVCIACWSEWDCDDPAKPACDRASGSCSVSPRYCEGDDGHANDNGPAGATSLALGVTTEAVGCAGPWDREVDYYAFDLPKPGTALVHVEWPFPGASAARLWLWHLDPLVSYGGPYPELGTQADDVVENLPAGRYILSVHMFVDYGVADDLALPYAVTVTEIE